MTRQLPKYKLVLKALELSEVMNPYPEHIFKPMDDFDQKRCAELIQEAGYSPDRFCAHMMRLAYINAIRSMKERILAEFEQ